MASQRRTPWMIGFFISFAALVTSSVVLALGNGSDTDPHNLGRGAPAPAPPEKSAEPGSTLSTVAVLATVISGLAALTTATGTVATTVLAWRRDQRERELHEIELAKRRAELDRPPPPG